MFRARPVFEAGPFDRYAASQSDRTLPFDLTVERLWPILPQLGITRVARQTHLDRVGIPCWAAFRPNSKSLAGSQGKGLSDAAACASAIMEAVEVAVAEAPSGRSVTATAAELEARGERWFDPERFLPFGTSFDRDATLTWQAGSVLRSEQTIWVPVDLVDMDGEHFQLDGICKSSNGLASGNSEDEAVFHGLCELIERDAITLWSFLDDQAAADTAISPEEFGDPIVDEMACMIREAGLRLRMFDLTTNLGVPVLMAVIGPKDPTAATELEVTAGYGAHPVAARAALRAITEAAQSRVTAIASSRDDIHSVAFEAAAASQNIALLRAVPRRSPPQGMPAGRPLRAMIRHMSTAITRHDCSACVVPISAPDMPFSVVRILSQGLEDRAANINWRPGARSFDAVAML